MVLSCLLHIVHKGRYVSSSRRSLFFRASHNVTELESYCSALCQLRALVYFAQRLLTANRHGDLFFLEERGLSEEFVRQYASMHKGCFYGRCVGSQVRREEGRERLTLSLSLSVSVPVHSGDPPLPADHLHRPGVLRRELQETPVRDR